MNDYKPTTEDPLIELSIERAELVEGRKYVEAHLTAASVEVTIQRSGMGGDPYDKDIIRVYSRLGMNMPADMVFDEAETKIIEAQGSAGLIGAVIERVGREVSIDALNLMVRHGERVYITKDKKLQKGESL